MKTAILASAFFALALISCEKEKTESTTTTTKPMTEQVAEAKVGTFNAVCPISGEKVDPNGATVEYKGKKIGFCCPACTPKFQENPEKALKDLSPDGQKWIGKEPGHMH